MDIVRRFVLLAALLFWQGGFLFYAAVVIPIGREVLGNILEQARITRQATHALNLAGGIALVPLAWDILAVPDPVRARYRSRVLLWVLLLGSLLSLVWLRYVLERQFDPSALKIADHSAFSVEHQVYVGLSITQTVLVLVCLILTLAAWQARDQHRIEL